MSLATYLTQDLEREFPMTGAVLAAIPADKLAWKPQADLHTIGWNANHLVDIAAWTRGILDAPFWDIAPVGEAPPATAAFTDPRELVAAFEKEAADALAALRDAKEATFDEDWSLKMGGQTLFTMKKGDCLRKWVVSHLSHHRAIVSVYLRMAGIPLQSIFEIM